MVTQNEIPIRRTAASAGMTKKGPGDGELFGMMAKCPG